MTWIICFSGINSHFKKWRLIIKNWKKTRIISKAALKNIFKNFSEKCFPLPPESAYKYVEAKIKSKNERKAFTDRWIGNKSFSKGERDNIEMKLCFGNQKEPNFFLGNNNFDKLSFRLYGPLIEALKK